MSRNNFGKSFEFLFLSTKHQNYIYIYNSKFVYAGCIHQSATLRCHVREWSYEQASGFHEHVWQTVVDHPNIMDALEEILTRPNHLVRPLGACLGENSF